MKLGSGTLAISVGLGVAALAAATVVVLASVSTEPGHTLGHIDCRHHNHGAKWHADHGRILGARRGGRARERAPDRDELMQRSLTAGRPGGVNRSE